MPDILSGWLLIYVLTIFVSSGQGEIPDRRYSPRIPINLNRLIGTEPRQLRHRQLQSGWKKNKNKVADYKRYLTLYYMALGNDAVKASW